MMIIHEPYERFLSEVDMFLVSLIENCLRCCPSSSWLQLLFLCWFFHGCAVDVMPAGGTPLSGIFGRRHITIKQETT